MNRLLSIFCIFIALSLPLDAQEQFRFSSWNIQALGTSGSVQWNDALSIVARLDADIACFQEIFSNSEVALFSTFASAANYPHMFVANASGTLSGSLRAAVMSKYPILNAISHTSISLSGDMNANDISRDILEVQIQVPNTPQRLGIFILHLKASSGSTNDFRRTVEIIRTMQAVDAFKAAFPGAPWIVCGDINDDIGDRGFGNTFNNLPGSLPGSYSLGSDISFPLTYNPFTSFTNNGSYIGPATQEDSTIDTTREASGRRLDYLFLENGITVVEDEVYNSVRDNGVDDGAVGGLLAKSGSPLSAGVSLSASDHYVVAADLELPSTMSTMYPGTGEDIAMASGINATPTLGAGQEVKVAPPFSVFSVFFESPNSTFDFHVPYVVSDFFSTGGTVPTGPLPGMYFDLNNALVLFDGYASPTGFPQIIVPGGTTLNYLIPFGFSGISMIFQTAFFSNSANNSYVFSDAHQLDFQ
ncbi:MAG: endonuclease/exonuclease/phosphatase family metal-dependent hydrolase [Planctomycetota bacterium]|jgi:endonuclease/exonuclease/phosphatase family metal-dependent hydrolase